MPQTGLVRLGSGPTLTTALVSRFSKEQVVLDQLSALRGISSMNIFVIWKDKKYTHNIYEKKMA